MNLPETDSANGSVHVVVAVVTYQRPLHLEALLPLLLEQVTASDVPTGLMVVDNDPKASAFETVDFYDGLIRYVHEPRPGISAARNRALDEASGAKALIFIDDDERPEANWFKHLVRHWRESACVAVAGPVLSSYEKPLSPWMAAGNFFDRQRAVTGTRVEEAGAGNLLLDLRWIDRHRLRFNEHFGLSGGEDTLFTRQITQLGGSVEWNDEARATEIVPVSRTTPRWVLRRSLRKGNTWARVSLILAKKPTERFRVRMRLLLGGLSRLVLGAMRFVLGTLCFRAKHQAGGLRTLTRGLGYLMGICGHVYGEYNRPLSTATRQAR